MSEQDEVQEVKENPGVETFITQESESDGARKIELTFDFGRDINASIEKFGAEVVHGMFVKALKVAIQANVRRMLGAVVSKEDASAKFTDEQIKNWLQNEYKPGVRTAAASGEAKLDKIAKQLLKMPEDKRAAFIEKLMAGLVSGSGEATGAEE